MDYKNLYKITAENDVDQDSRFLFRSYDRKRFWETYWDKNTSFVYLKKMLIWQYARNSIVDNKVVDLEWKTPVYEFVRYLMKLLDGKIAKKKTLYIISEPNAGKTLFCDCIADYFLSTANLKVWNRTNNFPLEELSGARVVFWNEPNFESGNIPEMLKLLGGDAMSCAVKYNRPITVSAKPVIVTSNYQKFPQEKEFQERIRYDRWTACDVIESVGTKRLHPFALELLFDACETFHEELLR